MKIRGPPDVPHEPARPCDHGPPKDLGHASRHPGRLQIRASTEDIVLIQDTEILSLSCRNENLCRPGRGSGNGRETGRTCGWSTHRGVADLGSAATRPTDRPPLIAREEIAPHDQVVAHRRARPSPVGRRRLRRRPSAAAPRAGLHAGAGLHLAGAYFGIKRGYAYTEADRVSTVGIGALQANVANGLRRASVPWRRTASPPAARSATTTSSRPARHRRRLEADAAYTDLNRPAPNRSSCRRSTRTG